PEVSPNCRPSILAMTLFALSSLSFLFPEPATTEIYTLSLHDALPILSRTNSRRRFPREWPLPSRRAHENRRSSFWQQNRPSKLPDRKSTRLNSSHVKISYAVFCLKKKKTT